MTYSEKLDLMLSKLDALGNDMHNLQQRVTIIENKLEIIENRVEVIENNITIINNNITIMENSVTDMKITIENELRVNIQRIAEGHLDLSRKLNECIKIASDIKDKQELQDIYINMHNNKLRTVQA